MIKRGVIREELRRVVYMTDKDVTRAGLTRADNAYVGQKANHFLKV